MFFCHFCTYVTAEETSILACGGNVWDAVCAKFGAFCQVGKSCVSVRDTIMSCSQPCTWQCVDREQAHNFPYCFTIRKHMIVMSYRTELPVKTVVLSMIAHASLLLTVDLSCWSIHFCACVSTIDSIGRVGSHAHREYNAHIPAYSYVQSHTISYTYPTVGLNSSN